MGLILPLAQIKMQKGLVAEQSGPWATESLSGMVETRRIPRPEPERGGAASQSGTGRGRRSKFLLSRSDLSFPGLTGESRKDDLDYSRCWD